MDFIKRLSSRKFLITVGGLAAVTAFPEHTQAIVMLVLGYDGAEGFADIVERYQNGGVSKKKLEMQQARVEQGYSDDDGATADKIVPGL